LTVRPHTRICPRQRVTSRTGSAQAIQQHDVRSERAPIVLIAEHLRVLEVQVRANAHSVMTTGHGAGGEVEDDADAVI
jgi:hypothetical protein